MINNNCMFHSLVFNTFPSKPWFLPACILSLKSLLEKENLLINVKF